jgi:hypothetical protein
MATFVRGNPRNNHGNFQDAGGNYTDLCWYAIGVCTMQQRALDDPASWFAGSQDQMLNLAPVANPTHSFRSAIVAESCPASGGRHKLLMETFPRSSPAGSETTQRGGR